MADPRPIEEFEGCAVNEITVTLRHAATQINADDAVVLVEAADVMDQIRNTIAALPFEQQEAATIAALGHKGVWNRDKWQAMQLELDEAGEVNAALAKELADLKDALAQMRASIGSIRDEARNVTNELAEVLSAVHSFADHPLFARALAHKKAVAAKALADLN